MTEDIEPASANSGQPFTSPDSPVYGIKWPANRLTSAQMRTLRQISKDVRLPITQLLKDAVDVYLSLIKREMQAMMVAEPAGRPEISESNVPAGEATSLDQQLVAESEAAETPDENSPTG